MMNTDSTRFLTASAASDEAAVEALIAADKRPRIVGKVTVAEAWQAVFGRPPASTPVPGDGIAQTATIANSPSPGPNAPGAAVPASPCQTRSRLGALAQLPGEARDAYCALIRYAGLDPMPNTEEFCRSFGFAPRTVRRWRKLYHWEERLQSFLASEALTTIPARRAAAAAAREARTDLQFDLRARSVELASAALSSWLENADEPPNLSAVVRALEFAGKLNPGPSASSPDPGERANAEFLARIEKVYGAAARGPQWPVSENRENPGQSVPNCAKVGQNPALNTVPANTVAGQVAHPGRIDSTV